MNSGQKALHRLLMLALVAGITCALAGDDFQPRTYKCAICLTVLGNIQEAEADIDHNRDFDHEQASPSFGSACASFFPADICADPLFAPAAATRPYSDASFLRLGSSPREFCRRLLLCPAQDAPYLSSDAPKTLDYRVSKVVGNKGYDKVRVSVVSNGTIESEYLPYSQRFKYRWTDMFLSSGVVTVVPGVHSNITVAGTVIDLYVPAAHEGMCLCLCSCRMYSSLSARPPHTTPH
jgi:hypothetical protein